MNAFDDIERQMRASVAARAIEAGGSRSGAQAPRGRLLDPRGRSRTRRRLGGAGALAVALAGIVLLVGLLAPGSEPGPSGAAAATLERLARIAASGPSLVPGRGQYLYVESDNDYAAIMAGRGTECITYSADHRQVWKGADGSGLLRDRTGPSSYTSSHDRSVCRSMKARPLRPGTSNAWFAANCFSPSPLGDGRTPPTEPRALLAKIQQMGGHAAAQSFDEIGSLLQETDASPALRAAVYRATALIPGVQLLGLVRDHSGRRGLGVALQTRQERSELIFNPRTAALLGMQTTSRLPGLSGWTVYRSSRVVNHLPSQPPAPLSPPCQPGGAGYGHTVHGQDVMTGRPAK